MIEASAKMSLLFAIVEESVRIGDRVLLFSQSLFTLDLIEEFLQRNKIPGKDENWCRNCDYYRKYNMACRLFITLIDFLNKLS